MLHCMPGPSTASGCGRHALRSAPMLKRAALDAAWWLLEAVGRQGAAPTSCRPAAACCRLLMKCARVEASPPAFSGLTSDRTGPTT